MENPIYRKPTLAELYGLNTIEQFDKVKLQRRQSANSMKLNMLPYSFKQPSGFASGGTTDLQTVSQAKEAIKKSNEKISQATIATIILGTLVIGLITYAAIDYQKKNKSIKRA